MEESPTLEPERTIEPVLSVEPEPIVEPEPNAELEPNVEEKEPNIQKFIEKTANIEQFKDYFTNYNSIFNTEKSIETLNKISYLEKKPTTSFNKFTFNNNITRFRESMKMKMI